MFDDQHFEKPLAATSLRGGLSFHNLNVDSIEIRGKAGTSWRLAAVPDFNQMPAYNFDSLSSIDFEELVRDLLQKELQIRLESFKAGRDRGIDLRYSIDRAKSLVVQCKHYVNTPYAKLLSDLKRKELPKVERLAPTRYILATSLGLTPDNKDELLDVFSPFCKAALLRLMP